MKKNITKIITLLAVLAMVFTLTACGGGDSKDGDKVVYRTIDEILESGEINIGVFSDKSPFGYVDENGEYQGCH